MGFAFGLVIFFALLVGLAYAGYRFGRAFPSVSIVVGPLALIAVSVFWALLTRVAAASDGIGAAFGFAIISIPCCFIAISCPGMILGALISGGFNRRIIFRLLGIFVVVFSASILYVGVVGKSFDFCAERGKVLSNEDFIESAIQHEARQIGIDGSPASIRRFHAENPNCCRISRKEVTLMNRLKGFAAGVEIYYKRKVPDGRADYYGQNMVLNHCGGVGRRYGEGIPADELPYWACDDKASKLSDKELIKIAIRSAVRSRSINIDGSEMSISDFFTKYPKCCRVTRTADESGRHAVSIDMYYPVESGNPEKSGDFHKIHTVLNRCAKFAQSDGPSRTTKQNIPDWAK